MYLCVTLRFINVNLILGILPVVVKISCDWVPNALLQSMHPKLSNMELNSSRNLCPQRQ